MKTSPLPSGSQKPRSDAPFAADSESRPPASNRLAAVCRKSCSRARRKPGRSRATRHRQRAWSAACGACSSSQRRGDGGGHRYDASRSLSLGGDEGEASVGLALQRAFDGDEVVVEVDVAPAESWRLALTRAEGQVDDPGCFASVFGGDLKECLGLLDRQRADLRVRREGGSTSNVGLVRMSGTGRADQSLASQSAQAGRTSWSCRPTYTGRPNSRRSTAAPLTVVQNHEFCLSVHAVRVTWAAGAHLGCSDGVRGPSCRRRGRRGLDAGEIEMAAGAVVVHGGARRSTPAA